MAQPESTSPAATPATEANQPAGVTSPDSTGAMSASEAERILSGLPQEIETRGDPLSDDSAIGDPLTDEGGTNALGEYATEEETPEEVQEETPETTEEQPEEETPTPPVEQETPEGRKRLNINRRNEDGTFVYSARDRAVMRAMAEDGLSLEEALAQIGGSPSQAQEKQPETKEDAPPEKTVAEIEALIKSKQLERKKAGENLNGDLIAELSDEIEALRDERDEAKQRERQKAQEQQTKGATLEQAIQASEQRVLETYPEMGREGSPSYEAFMAEMNRAKQVGGHLFNDPEWPETIAAKVAVKLSLQPKVKAAAPAPKLVPKAPAPKVRATPLASPGAVSAPSAPRNEEADLSAQLQAALTANDSAKVIELSEKIARRTKKAA